MRVISHVVQACVPQVLHFTPSRNETFRVLLFHCISRHALLYADSVCYRLRKCRIVRSENARSQQERESRPRLRFFDFYVLLLVENHLFSVNKICKMSRKQVLEKRVNDSMTTTPTSCCSSETIYSQHISRIGHALRSQDTQEAIVHKKM